MLLLNNDITSLIPLLTVITLTGTIVFSVTPKGIQALVALNNWLGRNVFNSQTRITIAKLETRVAYIEGELGIADEDEARGTK